MRTLTIAAVQLENRPGDPAATRAATERLVARAAEAGADLVVLPELSATGYVPNDTVWDLAEPLDGPALRHAREVAVRHRVHLGTGFVERDGTDLYNTYALIGPDGALTGSVRKHEPETACFRPGAGDGVVETTFGPERPPTWDGWLQPGSRLFRRVVLPLDAWWGARRYRIRRRQRAGVSSGAR
jgi:predicted amidohydrolase